jgi:EAL domain-containing protein (putative c-di-GMP-specific phosphodiesterase class I)
LVLHYQPKMDLRTGRVTSVEALVRWEHPQRGMIPPNQFIGIAEETGLIAPLTLWVLEAALRQCYTWARDGHALSVAVNLSARNLHDPELPELVARRLDAAGVAPGALVIEITESTLMADPERALGIVRRLHEMGVRIAIDDFGTGYSSLSYLTRLPVSELKIDQSFVRPMAQSANETKIVRSTIGLAHDLGLTVVAEGIEDHPTWDLLAHLGCDVAQGYYISRPRPAADLTRWLTEAAREQVAAAA